MMRRILLSFVVLTLACGSAWADPPDWDDWKRILGNPISEAKAALERGDRRFLAVQGYSTTAPGVSNEQFFALDRADLVIIDDTTDYIQSWGQQYFKERAEKYALAYNRYILEHAPKP